MLVTKYKSLEERRLLISLVVDKTVLGAVTNRWEKDGLFSNRWSNLIANWCVDHYRKYKKAPGKVVEGLFDSWAAEGHKDKETVKFAEQFLASLSGQYESQKRATQSEYMLDLAGTYFTEVRMKKVMEEVQGHLEAKDHKKAQTAWNKYHAVELGMETGSNIVDEENCMSAAFEERRKPLVKYPGAMGTFFDTALERDALIAFMGPEKSGKSFCLIDVGWTAMLQKKKVVFFAVGDMSKNQMLRRIGVRAAQVPMKPCTVRKPIQIEPSSSDDPPNVIMEERVYEYGLTGDQAWRAICKVRDKRGLAKDQFKLSVHPNNSISYLGIESWLDGQARDGWVPDVIVIDYADILAPVNGTAETRDQINTTWKGLRSLSQKMHCLVVTATQADAASYNTKTLDRSNFSEDKRKLAHATGVIGINQNDQEKRNGIHRYNWIVVREQEFDIKKCVYAAGCLALCRPMMFSTF